MKQPRSSRPSTLVIEQNNATGRISYWDNVTNHSEADRNGVSMADYIHAMFGFLRQAKARRVLMIGCGGGNLATMLYSKGVAVTIVDISAVSFEIARNYFHLPRDIECHVADGTAFLRRTRVRYDAIVLDAYDDEAIPKQFLRKYFFDLAKSRMAARNAIFLMNIIVANDADRMPDRIVRLMRKTWRDARLHDADGWDDRNAVAVAGAVSKLKPPRLLMPPARGANKIAKNLKELDFRALRA